MFKCSSFIKEHLQPRAVSWRRSSPGPRETHTHPERRRERPPGRFRGEKGSTGCSLDRCWPRQGRWAFQKDWCHALKKPSKLLRRQDNREGGDSRKDGGIQLVTLGAELSTYLLRALGHQRAPSIFAIVTPLAWNGNGKLRGEGRGRRGRGTR